MLWSPRLRPLVFAFLSLAAGAAFFGCTGNLLDALVACMLTATLLILTRHRVRKEYRLPWALTVPTVSSFIAQYLSVIHQMDGWTGKLRAWIDPIAARLNSWVPQHHDKLKTDAFLVEAAIVLFILLAVINYVLQLNTTIDRRTLGPLKKEELDLMQLALRSLLENDPPAIGWGRKTFVPLEAEVELSFPERGRRRLFSYWRQRGKRVTELLPALRYNRRSYRFLLLGDPGSGKSIALCQLAATLIKEAGKNRSLPLYIPLREWHTDREIHRGQEVTNRDVRTEVTNRDVRAFILRYFEKELNNPYYYSFFEKHFDQLHAGGYLFYLFDGFDEIPLVLGSGEQPFVVEHLSVALRNFLHTGKHARGILSSRYTRHPTHFSEDALLEIRPFTEPQIAQTLETSYAANRQTVLEVLERTDLVSGMANPFISSLMVHYLTRCGRVPADNSVLFEKYVTDLLQPYLPAEIQLERALEGATAIGAFILKEDNRGLAVPVHTLQEQVRHHIPSLVEILGLSGLARISPKADQPASPGEPDRRQFRFSHKRLNEYFVARYFEKQHFLPGFEVILEDRLYRDTLVLYCLLYPDNGAPLARDCWDYIRHRDPLEIRHTDAEGRRCLNCLRFLQEAFAYNQEVLRPYIDEMAGFIVRLSGSKNLFIRRAALESSAFLDPLQKETVLLAAFGSNNASLQEAAFRKGRTKVISPAVNKAIYRYLLSLYFVDLLQKKTQLTFILRLSDSLKKARRFFYWIQVDDFLFLTGCILLCSSYWTILFVVIYLLFEGRSHMYEEMRLGNQQQFYAERARRNLEKTWRRIRPLLEKIGGESITPEKIKVSEKAFFKCMSRLFISMLVPIFWDDMELPWNSVQGILLILGAVLTFPLLDFVLFVRSSEFPGKLRRYLIFYPAFFAALFALLVPLAYVADYVGSRVHVPDTLQLIGEIVIIAAWLGFVGVLWYFSIRHFFRLVREDKQALFDKESMGRFIYPENKARSEIKQEFLSLHAPGSRMEYVANLRRVRKATGDWPDNELPDLGDAASVWLHQMDQRWVGDPL